MFIKKIIVGIEMPDQRPWRVDGLSDPTVAAMRQAFELAAATDTSVELVTVLPDPGMFDFGNADSITVQIEQDRTDAAAVLEQIRTAAIEDYNLSHDVGCTVTSGKPWEQLAKIAGTDSQNLLMCGTRDVDVVRRWLFGTTGLKLLRYAACPVWLVRPPVEEKASLDVVAATDLSEIGQQVIEAGVTIGRNLPARLTVLHVVDGDLDRHMARTGVPEEELVAYRRQLREEAGVRVKDQLSLTDYRTVELGVQVQVSEGPADSCVLSALEDLQTDLLILATSGRGGLPGMLFGTTAERLLPDIRCSLLLIKPQDAESPVQL